MGEKEYFKLHATTVDLNMQQKLKESYRVQERSNRSKHAKVFGIDPMSTALALSIVRLYQNKRDYDAADYSQ